MYKARFDIKRFQQKKGIDYFEVFSLVVKITTSILVLVMVATKELFLEKLELKIAFL